MTTLTLRPNATCSYSQFVEVPNSTFIWGDQFESSFTPWTSTTANGTGTNTINTNSTYVHHGTNSYLSTNPSDTNNAFITKTFTATQNVYVHFTFKTPSTWSPSESVTIFFCDTGGGGYVYINLDTATMNLKTTSALFTGATSATGLSANTFYEIVIRVDDTSGTNNGHFQLWLNNTEITDIAMTWNGYGSTPQSISLGCYNAGRVFSTSKLLYFDCIEICTVNEGTEARYNLVNDQSDNTALQVTASTTQKETELLQTTAQTGTIASVEAHARVKASVITDTFVFVWRTHSSDYETSVPITLTTSFAEYSETKTTNPNTGNAWTWNEVNALELGSRTPTNAAGNVVQFSEYWIVVNYTSGVSKTYFGDGSVWIVR